MNLRELDLNLLRIFDAVYRQRNVSRAAEVLGLSQPAVSHGLTRLRLLLGDALFMRRAGGVALQSRRSLRHARPASRNAAPRPGPGVHSGRPAGPSRGGR